MLRKTPHGRAEQAIHFGHYSTEARLHPTFAKSTPRQPNSKIAPAANGTSGIRVAEMAASMTTATISKASAPSSTNSPINSRNTAPSMFMAKPPRADVVPGRLPRFQRPGTVPQKQRSQDRRPAKPLQGLLPSKIRRTQTALRRQQTSVYSREPAPADDARQSPHLRPADMPRVRQHWLERATRDLR